MENRLCQESRLGAQPLTDMLPRPHGHLGACVLRWHVAGRRASAPVSGEPGSVCPLPPWAPSPAWICSSLCQIRRVENWTFMVVGRIVGDGGASLCCSRHVSGHAAMPDLQVLGDPVLSEKTLRTHSSILAGLQCLGTHTALSFCVLPNHRNVHKM